MIDWFDAFFFNKKIFFKNKQFKTRLPSLFILKVCARFFSYDQKSFVEKWAWQSAIMN